MKKSRLEDARFYCANNVGKPQISHLFLQKKHKNKPFRKGMISFIA